MNNVNRVGYSTIGGTSAMAQIAKQDQYVEDVHGIRRLVKAGDVVPVGLFAPGAVEVDDVDTRSLGRPVVDEDASRSMADRTGDDASRRTGDDGVSFDRAEELRQAARSEKPRGGRRAEKAAE